MISKNILLLHFLGLLVYFTIQCAGFCKAPKLELLIKPKSKYLVAHWDIEESLVRPLDWVGIYTEVNFDEPNKNLLHSQHVSGPFQWTYTQIKVTLQEFGNFSSPHYLGYTAVYWSRCSSRRSTAILVTKLTTFPNWMGEYYSMLSGRRLFEIFIPGTYGSVLNDNNNNIHSAVGMTDKFSKFAWAALPSFYKTQDMSILDQLKMGIRYLDLRVVYYNNKFYFGDGGLPVVDLDTVIDDVLTFASKTEKEIIIFHLNEFQGFPNHTVHANFVTELKEKFNRNGKQWWVPAQGHTWNKTLEEVLNNNNTAKVIVSCGDGDIASKFGASFLWDPIPKIYIEEDDYNNVIAYFTTVFFEHAQPEGIHVSYLAIQPKLFSANVADNFFNGINGKTEQFAPDLYFFPSLSRIGRLINILATPYFMGPALVRIALQKNQEKFLPVRMGKVGDDSEPIECDALEIAMDKYYQTTGNLSQLCWQGTET